MNNIKKAALGVLIAGLAFGFSAFTTIKRGSVVTYYKVDMTYPVPTDPRGYSYFSGDRCEPNGTICSGRWEVASDKVPTIDGTPLPTSGGTFVSGSLESGHFE